MIPIPIPLRDSNGEIVKNDEGEPIMISPQGLIELIQEHLSAARDKLHRANECLLMIVNSIDLSIPRKE